MENLDRASVACPDDYPALIRWGMERDPNNPDNLRYKFTCAQAAISSLTGVYTHEFPYYYAGESIAQLIYHNVTCPPGYFFQQFKTNADIQDHKLPKTRYSVTCLLHRTDITPEECADYPAASGNPICPDGKFCSDYNAGIFDGNISRLYDYVTKGCPDDIPIQSTCKEGELELGWYIDPKAGLYGGNCKTNCKGRVCGTFSRAFNVCAICHHSHSIRFIAYFQ